MATLESRDPMIQCYLTALAATALQVVLSINRKPMQTQKRCDVNVIALVKLW